jgi:hypothetical protein
MAPLTAGEVTPGEAAELSKLVEAYIGALEGENSISGFGQLRQETMRRDLERRLRAVEAAGSGRIEIWVRRDDGLVRSPRGEQMTFEEAEALAS